MLEGIVEVLLQYTRRALGGHRQQKAAASDLRCRLRTVERMDSCSWPV